MQTKPRTKKKAIYNSLKIKRVVPKIIENHGNISKSMREVGYSVNTAKKPSNLTETKAYKVEVRSVLEKYESIRNKILDALENKDLEQAETFTLASALKGVTHDIQLLSGNKTENVGIEHEREALQAVLVQMRSQ